MYKNTFLFVLLLLAVSVAQAIQGQWVPINLPLPAPRPTEATAITPSTAAPTAPTQDPNVCTPQVQGCLTAAGCTVDETAAGMDGTCALSARMPCNPFTCITPPAGTTNCVCTETEKPR